MLFRLTGIAKVTVVWELPDRTEAERLWSEHFAPEVFGDFAVEVDETVPPMIEEIDDPKAGPGPRAKVQVVWECPEPNSKD